MLKHSWADFIDIYNNDFIMINHIIKSTSHKYTFKILFCKNNSNVVNLKSPVLTLFLRNFKNIKIIDYFNYKK